MPQQAWPSAPQGVPDVLLHDPLLQVPLTPVATQAWPAPTQSRVICAPVVVVTQQPLPLQVLAPQHGWPGAPHAVPELPPPPPPPAPVWTSIVDLPPPQLSANSSSAEGR